VIPQTLIAVSVLLLIVGASPTLAADREFTLTNETSSAMITASIAPTGTQQGREIIQPNPQLDPGQSRPIVFDDAHCVYDITASFADRSTATLTGADLCSGATVAFRELF
jgi:hypothetical protein